MFCVILKFIEELKYIKKGRENGVCVNMLDLN